MEWSPSHGPTFYAAAGVGLAAALLLARGLAVSATARRLPLLALRGAALAVLLVILLEPVRVTRTTLPGRVPGVAFLVDGSRSMALEGPFDRLARARALLADAQARVDPGRGARVELFRFGDDLAAVDRPDQLAASDDATRLRDALERLPSRLADDLPRAAVVVSDGRDTDAADYAPLGEGFRRLGVPVHVVPLGNPAAAGDVAVQDVVAPREVRPGEKAPVRVVVRSVGFAGRRAEVVVRSADEPRRKPLAVLPITLVDGESVHELVIEPEKTRGPLVLEVPPLAGEAVAENNRVALRVAARDPKVRVLYMEGTPNGEYRFLHDALVEDPNISCLSMEVDSQYNQVQRLQRVNDRRRGFPTTREELFGYDVVICSDIARAAFTPQQLAWTVELVAQRGGGFAMIGGNTSFGAGLWDQTAWDGMIPIDMSGEVRGGRGTYWNVAIKIAVPPAAEDHPIWRIVDDPARNREVIARMPVFYGTNLTDRLKPAATALGMSNQSIPGVGVIPVISCQSYGRGRTFALSSDSTKDWGRDFETQWGEGDNRYFRKFWRNVVRWLSENSSSGGRRLRVETDKVLYRPGDPVRLTARALDAHLEETRNYRLVARLGGPDPSTGAVRSATLTPRAGGGPYEAELAVPDRDTLPPNGAGARALALHVTAYEGNRVAAEADLDIQVMNDSPEFRDPRPDHARLAALARGSGGRVLTNSGDLASVLTLDGAQADRVVVTRSPAWDRPWLWLLLLGLLSTEWVVRRAAGLA